MSFNINEALHKNIWPAPLWGGGGTVVWKIINCEPWVVSISAFLVFFQAFFTLNYITIGYIYFKTCLRSTIHCCYNMKYWKNWWHIYMMDTMTKKWSCSYICGVQLNPTSLGRSRQFRYVLTSLGCIWIQNLWAYSANSNFMSLTHCSVISNTRYCLHKQLTFCEWNNIWVWLINVLKKYFRNTLKHLFKSRSHLELLVCLLNCYFY